MSFSVIIAQYLLPCAIVSACYISVCRYLASRPILASDDRQEQIRAKRRRNTRMLIVVSIAHFMSWLPLNVVNVIMDTFDSDQAPLFQDIENHYITYAICHLTSMTSAISNPLLYGYMNENFRHEFRKICWKLKPGQWDSDKGMNQGHLQHMTISSAHQRRLSETDDAIEADQV